MNRRLQAAVVAMMIGVSGIGSVVAQSPSPTEYQIKAAYLYNFGRFVQWPPRAPVEDSFQICVLGRDPFGPILDEALAGLSIDGHVVIAKRIGKVQESEACHILFIAASKAPELKETLTALQRTSVLTVSDMPEFAQRGGAIQFVLTANKVRFEINLAIAENAGLVLSSDLLKVAVAVRKTIKAGD